jgi:hypothetical protein
MSSILNNVFRLIKIIEQDSFRIEIRKQYEEMHHSETLATSIGYNGRTMHNQFLGYLIINGNRDNINSTSPWKIPEIPNELIEKLSYGHSYIKKVNEMCLAKFSETIPNASTVLDPYWICESKRKYANEINIRCSELERLVQSFQLGRSYQIISNRLKYMPQIRDMKQEDIAKAVYAIINQINKSGFKNCPDDLVQLSMKINLKNPESIIGSIIMSMIQIHSSLMCIDQLLFQAFVTDKMICLNQDNVFQISYNGSTFLSDSIELHTIEMLFDPGQIVIIDLPNDITPMRGKFYHINTIEDKFSQDSGNEAIVGARRVNDSASYFTNITDSIFDI